MKTSTDRNFYIKIGIALGLTVLIVLGLLFLIMTDAASRIRRETADPDQTPKITETPDVPSSSPTPEVTPTPEITPTPEVTPDTTPTPSASAEPSPSAEPTPSASAEPSPSAEPTPVPTAEPTPVPSASPEADITSDDSLLKISNMKHLISRDYVPKNLKTPAVAMYQTQTLRAEAADAIEQMFTAAANDGYKLKLVSGYRSYDRQKVLWNTYVGRYGKKEASRIDAYPGASEHITGLSVDIGTTDDKCRLEACFAGTNAYQWLLSHCAEYGYVLRYPDGKESVTGIKFSPWSFRYIGTEEAKKVMSSGKTLEEYYGLTD